jgi:hypothetical protein
MGISKTYPSPQPTTNPNHMTDVNSAESYYKYRAESDAKLKSMLDEAARLNNEIFESKLQAAVDRQVRDPEVSNLIFNLTKGSATETESGFKIGSRSLPEAIESIRDNESLQRFFSKVDVPAPAPKRVFNQGWDY